MLPSEVLILDNSSLIVVIEALDRQLNEPLAIYEIDVTVEF